jgi:hypothetical protein
MPFLEKSARREAHLSFVAMGRPGFPNDLALLSGVIDADSKTPPARGPT